MSTNNIKRMRALMALTALISAGSVQAQGVGDTFQVHGFMSQALILTDHNDFFGPSSDSGGSWEYTELGLNASIRPLDNVMVAGQVLARQAGDIQSIDDPQLDYGVIDYQFFSHSDATGGVQVGRFKNPFGLYNQTRDVAATRPSILLPQSIYFDRTRQPALAADGVMGYYDQLLNNGALRFQVGVGDPRMDDQSEITAFGRDDLGNYTGKKSYIGQVRYEHGGGDTIVALTYAEVNAALDSDDAVPGSGSYWFQPVILSLQYNLENWSFTTEYAYRRAKSSGFSELYNYDVAGESWYVQVTRRFGEEWQWLLRYDSLVTDKDDPSGRDYENRTGRPAYSRYAKDWTFGLQWQPLRRVLVSSELHRVEGTGWLPFQNSAEISSQEKYWNMLLFQVSYFF